MSKIINTLFLVILLPICTLAGFSFHSHSNLTCVINPEEPKVVFTALDLFRSDYAAVFDGRVNTDLQNGELYIGTIGLHSVAEKMIDIEKIDTLKTHHEGFLITVKQGKVIILGSDKRGTAYGILELSRIIGVSPWVWWADAAVEKKLALELEEGYTTLQYPSVARRGIFINDEDWGLMPWSSLTYEPSPVKGQIGPNTHARIFELLLRLRANTFWPAMHDCSVAFYLTPGNREMADKYGIYIGTSHCEPMVRNTNAEWKQCGTGEYNYLTNHENVLKFWEERVKELSGSDNIYTLGMRGVHDSKMLGANTPQEQKDALTRIIKDQRDMIATHVNQDIENVSQVFIPYKEVLDAYNLGLEVPEDVTLMWTDDNYGYIRHFPDSAERARKGGNGMYYHVSYWGRPHDYLWLATTPPALLFHQMNMAYDKGVREMWILNVGDIKPAEYLIELFMDMAWNIRSIDASKQGLDKHLRQWLAREFGETSADDLLQIMTEYYRLAYIRKPEYMGNTRTEEKDPAYRVVKDLPWSETGIKTRINEYETLIKKVHTLSMALPAKKQYSWFQLVEYPVRGAAEMNRKQLYGQLARHGKSDWPLSDAAFDTIVVLTERYDSLNNGKWNRMMDCKPRRLPVFDKLAHLNDSLGMAIEPTSLVRLNGNQYDHFDGSEPVELGLGYQRAAIGLEKGARVFYPIEPGSGDSVSVEIALLPVHPVEGKTLRYSIKLGEEPEQIVDFHTEGRSETWKLNVLRNQAITTTRLKIPESRKTFIELKAIDEGLVIDQLTITRL